jgi:hypothetical protein
MIYEFFNSLLNFFKGKGNLLVSVIFFIPITVFVLVVYIFLNCFCYEWGDWFEQDVFDIITPKVAHIIGFLVYALLSIFLFI